jgi:zona occludens toxin (predicted ATPase)
MNKNDSFRLKEIHDLVMKMNYTTDNLIDIVSLFKESIEITKKFNPRKSKNLCLNYLLKTHDKEYQKMISKETDDEDRKAAYTEFKVSFLDDLSLTCLDKA